MSKKLDKTKPAKKEKPVIKASVFGKDNLTHRRIRSVPGTKGFTPA